MLNPQTLTTSRIPSALWVLSALSFLVLFQGRWAVAPVYGFDESCYIEYLHHFLQESFPACYSKSHFWGASLTWIFPGFLAKLLSPLTGIPFTELAIPLIGLTSFLQWVASFFILYRTWGILKTQQPNLPNPSVSWVWIALLAAPLTPYVFRWNFFSHAAEAFLVSLTFYFLVKNKWVLAFLFAGWTFATRLNDIAILLIVGLAWISKPNEKRDPLNNKILFSALVVVAVPVLFKLWRVCFVTGYNGFYLSHVLKAFNGTGFKNGLLDHHHGLLWHDFLWLITLPYFILRLKKSSRLEWGLVLWQVSCLFIHSSQFIFWGFSENRLLIGSYLGVFLHLLILWPQMKPFTQKFWAASLSLAAFWRTWYFLAATAPGLRYWEQITRQKEVNPVVAAFQMLAHPIKTMEITAGLSPIGFSIFSLAKEMAFFQKYQEFQKYALSGSSLFALSFFTFLTLLFIAWQLRAKPLSKET